MGLIREFENVLEIDLSKYKLEEVYFLPYYKQPVSLLETLHFSLKDKCKPAFYDRDAADIYRRIYLGSLLVNYIPLEPLTFDEKSGVKVYDDDVVIQDDVIIEREKIERQALYYFYTFCNNGELKYTKEVFEKFFGSIFGELPHYILKKQYAAGRDFFDSVNYDTVTQLAVIGGANIDDYLNKTKDNINSGENYVYGNAYNIDYSDENGAVGCEQSYYLVVAYELVKRNYTVKRCGECGKWFVAYNKDDTKYCSGCGEERNRLIKANNRLKQIALKRCRDRKKDAHIGNIPNDKKWEDLEAEIIKKYNEAQTIPGMQEYSKWLKGVNKIYFHKARKETEV